MITIDILAQGDYFKFKQILEEPWIDVCEYMIYITDKMEAEADQDRFLERQRK